IASLLAASGIGAVVSVEPAAAGPPPRAAGPGDWPPPMAVPPGTPCRAPGGKPPVTRSRAGKRPDLAVLADRHDPEMASALVRDRIPHLAASAGEAIGVV